MLHFRLWFCLWFCLHFHLSFHLHVHFIFTFILSSLSSCVHFHLIFIHSPFTVHQSPITSTIHVHNHIHEPSSLSYAMASIHLKSTPTHLHTTSNPNGPLLTLVHPGYVPLRNHSPRNPLRPVQPLAHRPLTNAILGFRPHRHLRRRTARLQSHMRVAGGPVEFAPVAASVGTRRAAREYRVVECWE